MKASIRRDKLRIKGSPLTSYNPLPYFRLPDPAVAGNLPDNKKYSYGRETGFRVLPYTMQDIYSRELIDMEFDSVVMENDFLKAEFIPALGGRLWSLFDKKQNRDILYRNPLFRPANLAIRDAWFSGGIEWNIGRLGHSVHTCSPVFAGIIEDKETQILRIWEFERQTRLFWQIDFSLKSDSAVLYVYTRIVNPDKESKPLYWWTNTAVPQTQGVRVFSVCNDVIYIVPNTGKVKTMDIGSLPYLPLLEGKDASYPALFDYSNEYFFQNDLLCNAGSDTLPWESAVYEDGFTYAEASTLPLIYRKMFCWGSGRGGKRWQEFLSLPGQEYLELQAGLAPTQLHTADIEAGETVDFVQAFTAFKTDPKKAHKKDYKAAAEFVSDQIKKRIKAASLQNALEAGRKYSGNEAQIVGMGSGWGALENRLNNSSPHGLSFPDESIGEDEAQWAELINTGILPPRSAQESPGSFVIDKAWETLLIKSPYRKDDWVTPYHLGIISFERGDTGQAAEHWKESIKRLENPWACRNLALAEIKAGRTDEALDFYRQAVSLCTKPVFGWRMKQAEKEAAVQSFVQEYIDLLLKEGKEKEALAELNAHIHRSSSDNSAWRMEDLSEAILESAAKIALNKKDDFLLDKIFAVEHAHIREGNKTLIEIWTEREIRRLCDKGITRDDAEIQVQKAVTEGSLVPPKMIDFRMYYTA